MARSRYTVTENGVPHFLTITVVNWLPFLNSPVVANEVLGSLRFLQEAKRVTIFAYVMMENHLHLVASADDLSKELRTFKSYTARRIIDAYKVQGANDILEQLAFQRKRYKQDREYQFWQEGSHPQRIIDAQMMRQKITYIHYNPVKRGWVDEPIHWRYSSARNYEGMAGLLDVEMDWL